MVMNRILLDVTISLLHINLFSNKMVKLDIKVMFILKNNITFEFNNDNDISVFIF